MRGLQRTRRSAGPAGDTLTADVHAASDHAAIYADLQL
jgi:hypothetical protein